MMKLFGYICPVLMLLALAGCTKEDDGPEFGMGTEEVTLTFDLSANSPESFRAGRIDAPHIDHLELWVFDDKDIFVEKAVAENVTPTAGKNAYSYKVTLHKSNGTCKVHFVANYQMSDADFEDLKGRPESYVFTSLLLTDRSKPVLWKYTTVPKIDEQTRFEKIGLTPATCAVTLSIADNSLFVPLSYAVFNGKSKGTIAPLRFDASGNAVVDTTSMTGIPGNYSGVPDESDFIPVSKPLYFFEQSNNLKDSKSHPYIILKAQTKETNRIVYLKLDIVKTEGDYVRYDMVRGRQVELIINKIPSQAIENAPRTIADAAKSSPQNNISLSPDLLSSPIIDDGKKRLVVEKVIYIEPQKTIKDANNVIGFWAHYYPDKTKQAGRALRDVKDDQIKTYIVGGASNPLIQKVEGPKRVTSLSERNFSVSIKDNAPIGTKGSIVVYVEDDPYLKRMITFIKVNNYELKATAVCDSYTPEETYVPWTPGDNPGSVGDTRNLKAMCIPAGTPVHLHLQFPTDFMEEILPFKLRIFTDELSPESGQGFLFRTNGDNPVGTNYYMYQILSFQNVERTYDFVFRLINPRVLKVTADGRHYEVKIPIKFKLQTDQKDAFVNMNKEAEKHGEIPEGISEGDYYYMEIPISIPLADK